MNELTDEVLVALRRIIRATDLHSRRLGKDTGLTTPQLVVMNAIEKYGDQSLAEIGRQVSLSQATVTNILNRLEANGLVTRKRSKRDKRRVDVFLTAEGARLRASAPQPLQEEFVERFRELDGWEQHQMDAQTLDAAPMLATGEHVL
jgi:DNA-binding MarR family transcriptional regulator